MNGGDEQFLREGLLRHLVFGSVAEEVGREASGVVITANRNPGLTSLLRRALAGSPPGTIR